MRVIAINSANASNFHGHFYLRLYVVFVHSHSLPLFHVTYHVFLCYASTCKLWNLIVLQYNHNTCELACNRLSPTAPAQPITHHQMLIKSPFVLFIVEHCIPAKCSNNSSASILSWVIAVIIWVAHIIAEAMWECCMWVCVCTVTCACYSKWMNGKC